jgi:tRNA pseudouridine13 synthase
MNDPIEPPYWTPDLPGIGGRIRHLPEDFEVEEIPAYEPCGTGDHLFVWLEKRNVSAEFLLKRIAHALEIRTDEIGCAGLKDRHAVTRQYISVPATAETRLGRLESDDIRILRVTRHTHKLRNGHLRGNRFRILIRDADRSKEDALYEIIDRIRRFGLPNYYGAQRFGRNGDTAQSGLRLLRGERLPRRPTPFFRKLALSALQSWLFNDYLAERVRDGLLRTVLRGDVMAKWPTGGLFVTDDLPTEQSRFDRREIVSTGPLFGTKMFAAHDEAACREKAVLDRAGLTIEQFHGSGKLLTGTRRHNLIYLDELVSYWEPDGLRLNFSLPAGSYATVLLRELMKMSPHGDEALVEAPDA